MTIHDTFDEQNSTNFLATWVIAARAAFFLITYILLFIWVFLLCYVQYGGVSVLFFFDKNISTVCTGGWCVRVRHLTRNDLRNRSRSHGRYFATWDKRFAHRDFRLCCMLWMYLSVFFFAQLSLYFLKMLMSSVLLMCALNPTKNPTKLWKNCQFLFSSFMK